jgi:AcrR family transcriptional regulator
MIPATTPDIAVPRSHSAKRLSILDAAACVFCREGYGGANIDMVAAEAGVSRQTIYNHHGDKEKLFLAVVREMTERINAGTFRTLGTFPDKPTDLQTELTAFAVRMFENCVCNRDGNFLRKLIQSEGERYPELFSAWLEEGPGRTTSALAARFARLAFDGHLAIDDPDLAARQFMALVRADLEPGMTLGVIFSKEDVERASANGVRTFLRAFGHHAANREPA